MEKKLLHFGKFTQLSLFVLPPRGGSNSIANFDGGHDRIGPHGSATDAQFNQLYSPKVQSLTQSCSLGLFSLYSSLICIGLSISGKRFRDTLVHICNPGKRKLSFASSTRSSTSYSTSLMVRRSVEVAARITNPSSADYFKVSSAIEQKDVVSSL